jgi:hypothetical protein
MYAGAKAELPATVIAVGFPLQGQGGHSDAVFVHARESLVEEATGNSIGLLPGVAFNLDAQCAAVMGPCPGLAGDREQGEKKANYTAP